MQLGQRAHEIRESAIDPPSVYEVGKKYLRIGLAVRLKGFSVKD